MINGYDCTENTYSKKKKGKYKHTKYGKLVTMKAKHYGLLQISCEMLLRGKKKRVNVYKRPFVYI